MLTVGVSLSLCALIYSVKLLTDLEGQKACCCKRDGLIPYKRGVGKGSDACLSVSSESRQLSRNGMFCMPTLAQASPRSSRNSRHIQWSTSAIDTRPIVFLAV